MERVAFLIESTHETLSCLLNPNTLVMRRVAGVRPRHSAGGQLTGTGLADDPLLYTGGGRTELEMDLLFEVSVLPAPAEGAPTEADVRDLTRPLWNLAENAAAREGYGQPPLASFVWGKAFYMPGVITAVAERLEHFTTSGTPQRSWLRLRLVRVQEGPTPPANAPQGEENLPDALPPEGAIEDLGPPEGAGEVYEVEGGGPEGEPGSSERMDLISDTFLGDPARWRWIAAYNNIEDPLRLAAGTVLEIPTLPPPGGTA
jgi:hypothetical protein